MEKSQRTKREIKRLILMWPIITDMREQHLQRKWRQTNESANKLFAENEERKIVFQELSADVRSAQLAVSLSDCHFTFHKIKIEIRLMEGERKTHCWSDDTLSDVQKIIKNAWNAQAIKIEYAFYPVHHTPRIAYQ